MAILGSIAMAIIYGLKVNLSVAMVAMLNHTALKLASGGGVDHKAIQHVLLTNLTTTAHGDDENCGGDAASSAAIEVIS